MTNDETRVRELLQESSSGVGMRFADGFDERVMRRLQSERALEEDVTGALARQTRRILPALLAASLALVAWNWKTTRDSADSALDAALGIRATVATSSTMSVSSLEGAEAFQ